MLGYGSYLRRRPDELFMSNTHSSVAITPPRVLPCCRQCNPGIERTYDTG